MIGFVALALILVVLVLAALLVPLMRRRRGGDRPAPDATTTAYRARLAELEQEHASGTLSSEELREATDELERELLYAGGGDVPLREGASGSLRATGLVLAVAVPLCAVLLYGLTGHPRLAGEAAVETLAEGQLQRLQNMAPEARIDSLERWLDERPDSPRGWSLLGRSYMETRAFGDAVNAYARARAAGANDARLIARQAEALLLANDRRFTRSVWRLLEEALDRDARNGLALMLAGQGAFVDGRPAEAADYWQRLAEALPESNEQRAMIEQLVARARARAEGGGEPSASGGATVAGDSGAGASSQAAQAGPRLEVEVSLAAPFDGDTRPGDTVFVFARTPSGGGPPLAVARTRVGALPARVTLTDADAMAPQFRLSGADEVVVTARVSRSGQAQAQSGDLEGRSDPVAVDGATDVAVTIDRRVP